MVKRWIKGVMKPLKMSDICCKLCSMEPQQQESDSDPEFVGGTSIVEKSRVGVRNDILLDSKPRLAGVTKSHHKKKVETTGEPKQETPLEPPEAPR